MCFGKDQSLFMGLVIKDNDASVSTFLNQIDLLEYDKREIRLQMDILNKNPDVIARVRGWCSDHQKQYGSLACEVSTQEVAALENEYLRKGKESELVFIASSEVFLHPFSLRLLAAKDVPIIAPLLRPLPYAWSHKRNVFLNATESGYYKDHPDYENIAQRKKVGTFRAACVQHVYLIQARYASRLSFKDGSPYDFMAFGNVARKNQIPQFICNEREFGFYINSVEPQKELELSCLQHHITRETVLNISTPFHDDVAIKEYQEYFPIENYAIFQIEEDHFWVDDPWDWKKSNIIKQGIVWEGYNIELFKKYVNEGDTVIDLGGHIGTHTIALSKLVGPSGTVHTFEPQVKIFTELLVNTYLNGCDNVTPHHAAVGASEGQTFMMRPNQTNEGMTKIGSRGEPVSMKTVDSFNIKNVSLIKIDIEGYELEALKGALETVKRDRPVLIIEVFKDARFDEKMDFIKGLGYVVSHTSANDYLCLPLHRVLGSSQL